MKTHHLITTTTPPTLHEGFALNSLAPRIQRPEEMKVDQVNDGIPDGYKYVPDLSQPDYDKSTHRLIRAEVTLDGYGWTVEALTPEEIEEIARQNDIKSVSRDELLAALLFVVPDNPITEDQIRGLIKQELTNAEGFLANATTPEDIDLGKELVQKASYALVRFDSAGSFSHNHPLVNSLASRLGVDVQSVFKLAIKFRDPLYDHFSPQPEI